MGHRHFAISSALPGAAHCGRLLRKQVCTLTATVRKDLPADFQDVTNFRDYPLALSLHHPPGQETHCKEGKGGNALVRAAVRAPPGAGSWAGQRR